LCQGSSGKLSPAFAIQPEPAIRLVPKGLNMEKYSLQHQKEQLLASALPMAASPQFTPLSLETRTHVDTKTMCWHLGFAQQTARLWACKETYPEGLRPVRVNGRLKWPVDGIRKTLGVA
jgi:hypothetical protein